MARFYGTLKGTGETHVSRMGNKSSGLSASLSTHDERIETRLFARSEDDADMVMVHLNGYCLYHGKMDAIKEREGRVKWIADLVMDTSLRKEIVQELARRGLKEQFEEDAP